jgi:alpha-L-rhamnosidase
MISTGYLHYCAKILSEMAEIIGKKEEIDRYRRMASEIRTAFNREYWNEQTANYASGNQASNAFALYMGMADGENIQRVADNLAKDVERNGFHLTTGNLCTKYLLEMLTEYGYPETAYKVATQTTYPGWGYMLANGATTLWERWEYATGDAMNSHNHPMMGSVGSWFYKYVIGITPDMHHPGFSQFVIRPVIFDELKFAEGELNTVKGLIKCAWRKQGASIHLDVTIPHNATATVYIPAKNVRSVTESGRKTSGIREITFLREEDGYAVFRVASGNYRFKSNR